jgi:hypothetical protein
MRVTYEPGGMLTIVADDGIAVLPNGLPQELVDDVWAGLDSGDGVAAVLDALTRAFGAGVASLPPFAVAILQDDAVRTAVRGDLRLGVETLAGSFEVAGDAGDPWTTRLVADALAVHVRPGHDRPATTSELPIASGAVLASSVRAVFFEAEVEAAIEAEARDADGPDDLALADTVIVPPRGPAPERAADLPADTLDPGQVPAPAPRLGDHDGATLSAERVAALRGGRDLADPHDAAGDHDGVTIAFQTVGASEASARGPRDTAEVPLDAVDDSIADRVPPRPDAPGAAPTMPPAAIAPRGRIRLSTGEAVELDRPVIVGRRPRSSRTTGADVPRLVAVESPQNDISRNHVEITSDGETVVVTDLHTTNGTVLHRPGPLGGPGDPVRLHPGEQTVVVAGDVIDIGDGVTISFEDLP